MSNYKESHPWINFSLDIRKFPLRFWLDLGACISKCEHLANTALSLSLRDRLNTMYLQKGAQATTAIEGNTLSAEQVDAVIADKSTGLPPAYDKMEKEVRNVKNLFEAIVNKAQNGDLPPLSPRLICDFQRRILQDIPINGNVGKVRQRGVAVGTYRGAPEAECAALLEELCRWLNTGADFIKLEKTLGNKAAAVIRAVLAHVYIAWIHPFDDGNGRTARMVEFYLLFMADIPATAAHLLSNHCNKRRDEYYARLGEASTKCSPIAFLCFMVEGLREGLHEQLRYVYADHEQLVWQALTEEIIKGSTAARQRRTKLARLLLKYERWGKSADLMKNDDIALLYVNASSTNAVAVLYHDMEYLTEKQLIIKQEDGYCVNKAMLTAPKPPTVAE